MQKKSPHYTNSRVSEGLRNGLGGSWSHSQSDSPKAMPQDKWIEIPRDTRHTCSHSARAAEENVCVTLGQAIVMHSTPKTSEKAWCKPHTTVIQCWWYPQGPSCRFYIQTILWSQNCNISAALWGCQEIKPKAGLHQKHGVQMYTMCSDDMDL